MEIYQQQRFRISAIRHRASLHFWYSQAKLAIVLSNNPVALAGGVLKFLAVHDLHCATGVLDDPLSLQNTSCQVTVGLSVPSIVAKIMSDGQRPRIHPILSH